MIHNNYGYNLINSFKKKEINSKLLDVEEDIHVPYDINKSEDGDIIMSPKSCAFVNTSNLTKVKNYYEKHGVYTKADPVEDRYEYTRFWDREEERRKEGLTAPGELYIDSKGKYKLKKVRITGEHYGYLNYSRIRKVNDQTDINQNELVNSEDYVKKLFSTSDSGVKTAGKSKEYFFPDFWDGDYYYFHALEVCRKLGKHLVVAKARRKGYSYKNGWICANRADLYPRTVTAIAAYDDDALFDGGTFDMADRFLQYINDKTDWKKGRINDKQGYIKLGYREPGQREIEKGYLSSIIAEAFQKKPGVLRGASADLILVEEAGKAKNLAEFLDGTLPTLKAGRYIVGLMVVFGTGGGDSKYWEDFEDIFYNGSSQDFMLFENIFSTDKEEIEDEGIGYYVPDYANKEGFIDEFGNSNTIKAVDYEKDIRAKLKSKGKIEKLNAHKMEYSFNPSESFNRVIGNFFNSDLLKRQGIYCKSKESQSLLRDGMVLNRGKENFVFKDFKLMSDSEYERYAHRRVVETKLKPNKDNHGCFTQVYAPYKNVEGKVPDNLYRVWVDPFDVDKDKEGFTSKHSFGCIYVYEVPNNFTTSKGNKLVGFFEGRPERTDDFNEIIYNIAKYYNAKILYEKNKGDTYSFFKNVKKEVNMLADSPTNIFNKEDLKGRSNEKGIHINEDRKRTGLLDLKDWLEKTEDYTNEGKEIYTLSYIYERPLINELKKFNFIDNFDRISTLIVGMFDIKARKLYEEKKIEEQETDDDFFERALF